MFDLKDFQSQVFKNYKSLESGFKDAALFAEKGAGALLKNPNHGFFKRRFLKILAGFRVKFHNAYVNSTPFIEIQQKAEEIIENPKIKKTICESFKKNISLNSFKEELEVEIVITLTTILTKKSIAKEFSIEKDKLLFSIMTYKILEKGTDVYCKS